MVRFIFEKFGVVMGFAVFKDKYLDSWKTKIISPLITQTQKYGKTKIFSICYVF